MGKLNISIDPRFELLLTVQSLSSHTRVNRNLPYSKDALNYFESFSSHKAVELTDSLTKHLWAEDPIDFMLRQSQPYELKQEIVYTDGLINHAGEEVLEEYRKSFKGFAQVSNFKRFWESKKPFYNQILDLTTAEVEGIDLINVLENYFNQTNESYNVIIIPSFKGGIGSMITNANGQNELYSAVAAEDIEGGIPYMNKSNLLYLVWHEFGHSFVNPLTDKYADRVKGSVADSLYEPTKNHMLTQGYVTWQTCVNELVIRAIGVRLFELNLGAEESKKALDQELQLGFIYIEPLVEKLKEYEVKREKDNITFADFYPELLDVFDSLQKIEYWKQFDLRFKGPIYVPIIGEKAAVIYPTNDKDNEALKIAQEQAKDLFNYVSQVRKGSILIEDTKALESHLKDYGIVAFGTINSNLFLKRYASTFPFRIENQTLYADKEYTDKNLKFITCVPNPVNPFKGMAIYTGLSNNALQDINKKFYEGDFNFINEDYLLFTDYDNIVNKGFYNKDDKWQF